MSYPKPEALLPTCQHLLHKSRYVPYAHTENMGRLIAYTYYFLSSSLLPDAEIKQDFLAHPLVGLKQENIFYNKM